MFHDFQRASIIYIESPPLKETEQDFLNECCSLPLTGDSTILDLLPRTLWFKYFRLVEMLPTELDKDLPRLSEIKNPFCVAAHVIYLFNQKANKYKTEKLKTRKLKTQKLWKPNTCKKDEKEHVPKPALDPAIAVMAQSTGKVVRFIEQRQCLPFYRMPLAQVRECTLQVKGGH